jgi:uncharacterized protein (TIGR02147 family)
MINLFEYLDYREFLRDYYKERKSEKPFFSYRFIGSRVGMDSSYVIKVLQGALHIARNKIDAFIRLLDLNEKEAEYFATLVQFCRAKGERERKLCFDKLFSFTTVTARRVEASQYEFFQKWYYSAVWALIDCRPFAGDYRDLADRCMPAITVWDAKRAVRLLEKLGFISRGADKVFRTSALNLTTGQKWFSHAVEQYQREMIRLAGESIERFDKHERDISTVTLSVAESALPEVQEVIRQFRSTLIKIVNATTPSDRVYQLNVQLFPLSRSKVGAA